MPKDDEIINAALSGEPNTGEVNYLTLLSSYDGKLTLLQWLKKSVAYYQQGIDQFSADHNQVELNRLNISDLEGRVYTLEQKPECLPLTGGTLTGGLYVMDKVIISGKDGQDPLLEVGAGVADSHLTIQADKNLYSRVFTPRNSAYTFAETMRDGVFEWTIERESTGEPIIVNYRLPYGANMPTGNHFLALHDEITPLKNDILDLYRMVIRSGGTITTTDASVALVSQPFPLTVSPKALLDYVGGMCHKCENVLGLEKLTDNTIDGITVTTDGSVITMSGSLTKGVFYRIALSAPLEAGTYYCSWNASGTTAESITFRKSDSANIGNLVNGGAVTLAEKAYYIGLHFTDTGKTYNGTFKLMVSHGSTEKAYEPYFEGIKTAPVTNVASKDDNGVAVKEYPIPPEVKALDGYGYGINAECNNYIDFERKKFVKKVAKVDLGSINWTLDPNNPRYTYHLVDLKYPTSNSVAANIQADKYATKSADMAWTDKSGICASTTELIVYGSESPTGYAYYELATTTETDISEYLDRDLPDGDVIDVTAGGCLEFENGNDIGVPYSVTYQSKPIIKPANQLPLVR